MSVDLVIGDLVEIDAANLVAIARVRSIEGDRMHLALEQGGFVQWTDETVFVRRCGGAGASWDARITYAGASTVTLEVVGRSSRPSPTPLDTERDLGSR